MEEAAGLIDAANAIWLVAISFFGVVSRQQVAKARDRGLVAPALIGTGAAVVGAVGLAIFVFLMSPTVYRSLAINRGELEPTLVLFVVLYVAVLSGMLTIGFTGIQGVVQMAENLKIFRADRQLVVGDVVGPKLGNSEAGESSSGSL